MTETTKELLLIRKYLLGGLEEEDRERIEERVLTDAEFRDRVVDVEEDLIEEYAEGALDETERQRFEAMFSSDAQRQLDVRIVEELKQHAAGGWWSRLLRAVQERVVPEKWADSPGSFRKPAIAFALVIIIAIAFLIARRFWRSEQTPPLLTQEQTRRELVERELARLNSPSQSPQTAVAATLSPGLSRGDERPPEVEFPTVTLTRGTEFAAFVLRLRPTARQYKNFEAALTPIGTSELYKVDLLPVEFDRGAEALVLILPIHALNDGDYRVQLSVRAGDGRTEVLSNHYYYFRLLRR
jgi:anti-sigma-K factor RskA